MEFSQPEKRPPEFTLVTIRPGLEITSTCFRVGTRHFELKALDGISTEQSPHDQLTRHAAGLAFLGAVLLGFSARFMQPAGIFALVLVLCGLCVLAFVSARRRPRRMELWAYYRGQPTQLFASDDWWLFGAVERHLRRALADARMGRLDQPDLLPPRPVSVSPAVAHPSQLHPSKMSV